MRFLGNILTSGVVKNSEFYNVAKTKDELIDGIPTLIIGWSSAKEMYPNLKILDWKVDDLTYWTFGKRERRDRMEEDLEKFKKETMNHVIKSIKYKFVNLLTVSDNKKKRLFELIKDSSKKIVFVNNDMMYIYHDGFDYVIGFSLRDIQYECGTVKKIFNIIENSENIELAKDKEIITYAMRRSLKDKLYLIPYLCY